MARASNELLLRVKEHTLRTASLKYSRQSRQPVYLPVRKWPPRLTYFQPEFQILPRELKDGDTTSQYDKLGTWLKNRANSNWASKKAISFVTQTEHPLS